MAVKFTDDQKHDLCLAFVKERLARQSSDLKFDSASNDPDDFTFYNFIRDYSVARKQIDDCIEQIPD